MAKKEWYTRRKESKYYVNPIQHALLSALLGAVMTRDSNSNDEGFYFVRSVYLDSHNKLDFVEKEMGTKHRRKVRLRYYGETPSTLKFETKEKDNKHTIKRSVSVNLDVVEQLMNEDYSFLLNGEQADSTVRLYDHLTTFHYKPVTIVDYEREAYVSDSYNVRINFDTNMRSTRFVEHLFAKDPAMVPIIEPGMAILEVKHDGHLPDIIQQILSQADLTPVSYSKYYYAMLG